MLVLSRKASDSILIGDNIRITVDRISGNRVTLGIDAPKDVRILRGEVEVELEEKASDELLIESLAAALTSPSASFQTS